MKTEHLSRETQHSYPVRRLELNRIILHNLDCTLCLPKKRKKKKLDNNIYTKNRNFNQDLNKSLRRAPIRAETSDYVKL